MARKDEGLLKEKDLENHLEAEPGEDNQQDKRDEDKDQSEKDDRMRDAEMRIGPLTIEALKVDNQVMRALEMLRGYEIFRNLKG
jgi:carboxyl-terminal processing protease